MLYVGRAFVGGGTQEFSAFCCVCHTVVLPPLFHCRISFDDPHQTKCCGFAFLFFMCSISSGTHISVHAFLFIFKHSKSFKVVILVALVPCEWILQNNKIIYTMIRFSCYLSFFLLLISSFFIFLVHLKSSSDNPILIEMIEPRCEWCYLRKINTLNHLENFSVSVFDSAHFKMLFFQSKISLLQLPFFPQNDSDFHCAISTYLYVPFSYICIFHSFLFKSISFISTTHSMRRFLRARVY